MKTDNVIVIFIVLLRLMALNKNHDELNRSTIESHNKLRALHNSPKLTIDWDLAKSAQAYAEKLAKTNSFSHSQSNGQYGENLANSYNSQEGYIFSGDQATQNWYDEIKDYKFGEESQQTGKIGHFSQVVWKETKTAGFGRAQGSSGTWVIVGQYKPPGNFLGHFKENVNPPSGSPQKKVESPSKSSEKPKERSQKKSTTCCAFLKKKKTTTTNEKTKKELKPEIGPRNPNDTMIKTSKKTITTNGKKTVELTETYRTPEGNTYEMTKKTEEK